MVHPYCERDPRVNEVEKLQCDVPAVGISYTVHVLCYNIDNQYRVHENDRIE